MADPNTATGETVVPITVPPVSGVIFLQEILTQLHLTATARQQSGGVPGPQALPAAHTDRLSKVADLAQQLAAELAAWPPDPTLT